MKIPVRHGADIEEVTGIKIAGDEVRSPINYGINLTNCSNTAFIAYVIRAPGQAGVNIVDGAGNSFSDPQISGALNDGHDAIRVSGSRDLTIVGGKLGAERNAIYSTITVGPATPILAKRFGNADAKTVSWELTDSRGSRSIFPLTSQTGALSQGYLSTPP